MLLVTVAFLGRIQAYGKGGPPDYQLSYGEMTLKHAGSQRSCALCARPPAAEHFMPSALRCSAELGVSAFKSRLLRRHSQPGPYQICDCTLVFHRHHFEVRLHKNSVRIAALEARHHVHVEMGLMMV